MKRILTTIAACAFLSVGFGQTPCTDITADYTYQVDPPTGGIHFTDNTQVVNTGDTYTCSWDFGNGEASGENNPFMMFDEGVYQVSLTITGQNGCVSTMQKDVEFSYGGQ